MYFNVCYFSFTDLELPSTSTISGKTLMLNNKYELVQMVALKVSCIQHSCLVANCNCK